MDHSPNDRTIEHKPDVPNVILGPSKLFAKSDPNMLFKDLDDAAFVPSVWVRIRSARLAHKNGVPSHDGWTLLRQTRNIDCDRV